MHATLRDCEIFDVYILRTAGVSIHCTPPRSSSVQWIAVDGFIHDIRPVNFIG